MQPWGPYWLQATHSCLHALPWSQTVMRRSLLKTSSFHLPCAVSMERSWWSISFFGPWQDPTGMPVCRRRPMHLHLDTTHRGKHQIHSQQRAAWKERPRSNGSLWRCHLDLLLERLERWSKVRSFSFVCSPSRTTQKKNRWDWGSFFLVPLSRQFQCVSCGPYGPHCLGGPKEQFFEALQLRRC